MARSQTLGFYVGVMALLGVPVESQAVPAAVPYFGFLSHDNGAVYNGSVDVVVRLYSADSGGQLLWGPHAFPAVQVNDGMFTILLGGSGSSSLAPTLDSGHPLWLDFALGGQAMAPDSRLRAYRTQGGPSRPTN